MGMSSKRNLKEDTWASNEDLPKLRKPPGRPKKIKKEETRNVQLRLPVSLIKEIDELVEDGGRHRWILSAIRDKIKRGL